MSLLTELPENTLRRLSKVTVRVVHLVGFAGVFGHAMAQTSASVYLSLTIVSGVVLVLMEASSGLIWFVQLRSVALYLKLLLLWVMHLYPEFSISCLVAAIVISGFMSHAPSWIRYFSLQHGKVVLSSRDILG